MAEVAPSRSRARRLFWPLVLAGLAGAVLAAIAGNHEWLDVAIPKGSVSTETAAKPDSPATTALALVALAAWGVFLVTRGRVRRIVAVLAAVAALGALVTTFHRPSADYGWFAYTPQAPPSPHGTAWPWIALVAALLSLGAAVVAVVLAPRWPEMGRRYDAPTAPSAGPVDLAEAEPIELWKTISEGHDPTSESD